MPGENIQDWSTTAADNDDADTLINWLEGQPRSSVNDSARSMMAAHAKYRNLHNGSITTTGSANAQAFTSGVGYTSVPTGLRVLLKMGFSNTGALTLNMDGIGAVAVKNLYGAALTGGEVVVNCYHEFLYDGSNWLTLVSPSALVLVSSQTVTNAAAVDFTNLFAGTYTHYIWDISNVVLGTLGAGLKGLVSSDNGASWNSSGIYVWQYAFVSTSLAGAFNAAVGQTGLQVFPSSSVAGGPQFCIMDLLSGGYQAFRSWGYAGFGYYFAGSGYPGGGITVNGFRFVPNTGVITTGTFKMYGVRA